MKRANSYIESCSCFECAVSGDGGSNYNSGTRLVPFQGWILENCFISIFFINRGLFLTATFEFPLPKLEIGIQLRDKMLKVNLHQ